MIGRFNLGLMTGTALVVHGHMVGVGVIVAVGNAGDDAELLTVLLRKLAAQALGWRSEHGVVMMILLTEVVDAIAHISDNLQAQFLTLGTLTMMLACKGHEAFGQSDKADTEGSLVDHALDSIVRLQLVGPDPQALHQQGELLGKGGLLEQEAVIELLSCHLKHVVELGKEHIDALLLVLLLSALDGELHDVDGGKREVAAPDTGLRSEAVLEHTRSATHRGHLVDIALGIVGAPLAVLVVRCVEIQEVGEEPARRHLTGQLVEVEVTVLGQIVHTALLLPYLNGENSRLAIAHALVGREQDLTHDAATLGTRVGTIIDR